MKQSKGKHEGIMHRDRRGGFYVYCGCGWRSATWMASEAAWGNFDRHEWEASRNDQAEG